MKKLVLSLLLVAFAATFVFAEGASSFKTKAGGLDVELIFEEGHIHMGENHVSFMIHDASGNMVKDAGVKIEYGMPPMKNMAPMNYRARTEFNGEEYEGEINLSMQGKWFLVAKILRPGQGVVDARFEFNLAEEYHKDKGEHKHGHDHD